MDTKIDLSGIRTLILDMDGVLWRADEPIGSLPFIFTQFKSKGYKVVLATNNATRSASQYLDKLSGFGVNLEAWQIVNSSQAAADFLHKKFPQGGPVYVIGEEGLIGSLEARGFQTTPEGNQDTIKAVVVGMDRTLTYQKLLQATLLIRSGVPFIATNSDRTFPTPAGLVPGAGSILAALVAATNIEPEVIGKPSPEIYRIALQRTDSSPRETLVVGDRLETDIAGAQALGCYTALVLSGVTSAEAAAAWLPQPDLILPDLTALLEFL